jgi:hypothetical protein
MRIEFRKITKDGSSFELKNDELTFSGNFKRVSNSIVKIDYKLNGKLKHSCDGCAEEFELEICEESSLEVSDGEYSGDDIDIIETFDEFIDFDEIFQSEIEAIKSDYHYCKKCIENFKE